MTNEKLLERLQACGYPPELEKLKIDIENEIKLEHMAVDGRKLAKYQAAYLKKAGKVKEVLGYTAKFNDCYIATNSYTAYSFKDCGTMPVYEGNMYPECIVKLLETNYSGETVVYNYSDICSFIKIEKPKKAKYDDLYPLEPKGECKAVFDAMKIKEMCEMLGTDNLKLTLTGTMKIAYAENNGIKAVILPMRVAQR